MRGKLLMVALACCLTLAAMIGTAAAAESVLITNDTVRHYAPKHRHTHRTAHHASPRQILWAARPYAVDGDTFRSAGVRYRLQGIDTPERGQPKYLEAKVRLQQLLDSGEISIERKAHDKYGRTVALVRVNGQDVAATLKAEGFEKPPAYRTRHRKSTWM